MIYLILSLLGKTEKVQGDKQLDQLCRLLKLMLLKEKRKCLQNKIQPPYHGTCCPALSCFLLRGQPHQPHLVSYSPALRVAVFLLL